jgi:hypothetical protein
VSGANGISRPQWTPVDGCNRLDGVSTFLLAPGLRLPSGGRGATLPPDDQPDRQNYSWAARNRPKALMTIAMSLSLPGSGARQQVPRSILVIMILPCRDFTAQ